VGLRFIASADDDGGAFTSEGLCNRLADPTTAACDQRALVFELEIHG
jgi:hypothetical protein